MKNFKNKSKSYYSLLSCFNYNKNKSLFKGYNKKDNIFWFQFFILHPSLKKQTRFLFNQAFVLKKELLKSSFIYPNINKKYGFVFRGPSKSFEGQLTMKHFKNAGAKSVCFYDNRKTSISQFDLKRNNWLSIKNQSLFLKQTTYQKCIVPLTEYVSISKSMPFNIKIPIKKTKSTIWFCQNQKTFLQFYSQTTYSFLVAFYEAKRNEQSNLLKSYKSTLSYESKNV